MEQRYSDSYGDKANKKPLTTTVPGTTENIYGKPERNKKGSVVLALALATSILTSGCGATANTNNSAEAAKTASNPNQAPIKSTKTTPAISETALVSKAETVPTVESLEISADGTHEQIAKIINERLNDILTLGMNNETYNQWRTDFMNGVVGANVDTWSINYIDKNTEVYFKALCGSDLSDPFIAQLVQHFKDLAANHLDRYLRTTLANKANADKAVYKYKSTYDSLISYSAPYIINFYTIKDHETDNNHETSLAGSTWDGPSLDKYTTTRYETKIVVRADGKKKLYITNMSFVAN